MKQTLAVVLLVLLCVSLFAACGAQPGKEGESTAATETATQTSEASTKPTAEETASPEPLLGPTTVKSEQQTFEVSIPAGWQAEEFDDSDSILFFNMEPIEKEDGNMAIKFTIDPYKSAEDAIASFYSSFGADPQELPDVTFGDITWKHAMIDNFNLKQEYHILVAPREKGNISIRIPVFTLDHPDVVAALESVVSQ